MYELNVFLVLFFVIIGFQRSPISLRNYCELRISENVDWASKHALFLEYNYYDKIIVRNTTFAIMHV